MLVVRDLCTGLLIYSNMNARVRYLPNVVRGCVRSTAALDALVGRLARSTESPPSGIIFGERCVNGLLGDIMISGMKGLGVNIARPILLICSKYCL